MKPRPVPLLSTLGLFLFLWPLLHGKILFHGDTLIQCLSGRFHAALILREGEIPLWVEELFAGFPLHAEGQAGVFYPPNLFYLFLPSPEAFALLIALHTAVGFLGMAHLCRQLGVPMWAALAASALFVFSGPVTARWHQTNVHESLMWAPYVLSACTRRGEKSTPIVAAIGFALIWLSSHAHVAFIILLTGLLWWPQARFSLWRFALLASSALCLSAVQVLPLLELLRLSVRGDLSLAEASTFSLTPARLLSGMVSASAGGDLHFFSDPAWELNVYVGPAVVVFAALGWVAWRGRRLGWALSLLAGSLLALGDHFAGYRILFEKVPFFGLLRVPARFYWVVLLTLTVLCGRGLSISRRVRPLLKVILVGVFLLSLGDLVLRGMAQNQRLSVHRFDRAVAATRKRLDPIRGERFYLGSAEPFRRALADPSLLERHPLLYLAWLWPNTHLFSGYASAGGYTPLALKGWSRLFRPTPSRPALDVLSVRWLLAANLSGPTFRHRATLPGGVHLYENLTAEPWARLVGRARVLSEEDLSRALGTGSFARDEVLLTKPLCRQRHLAAPAGSVELVVDKRQIKRLRVVTDAPAYFVMAQTLYPGWRAFVDGKPAPLGAGYGYVQTLCLPPGAHTVEVRFFPLSFFLGYLLSCLSLIVGVLWCSLRTVAPIPES